MKLKIEEKRLDEIKPYENNPRDNDNAVDAVAESIKEFGFRVPILLDKNGVIVSGHTRLKAAEKLKLEKVPCIVLNELTESNIRQLRIVDNKSAELAKWDFAALADELDGIQEINMDAFGFAAFNETMEPTEVTSSLDEGEEVDLEEFDDEHFDHECPECGYMWNE